MRGQAGVHAYAKRVVDDNGVCVMRVHVLVRAVRVLRGGRETRVPLHCTVSRAGE